MIIQDLLSGVYQPYILRTSAVRRVVKQNIFRSELQRQQENLLATAVHESDLLDLLNWEPPLAPQRPNCNVGDVPVVGFDQTKLQEV